MRYIRNSAFAPDGSGRNTLMVSEEDLNTDIHTAATGMREHAAASGIGEHVDIEIFEYGGSAEDAADEAMKRAEVRMDPTFKHRLTLKDWLISLFLKIGPKTMISTSKPSPLLKGDIMEIMIEASNNPAYKGQLMQIHDRNGEPVSLYKEVP